MTKGILKFLVSIQILEGGDLYQLLQCLRGSVLVAVDVRPWILGLSDLPWPSSWLTRKVVVHWIFVQVGKAKFRVVHDQLAFFLRNQQTIVLQLLFICSYKLRSQKFFIFYTAPRKLTTFGTQKSWRFGRWISFSFPGDFQVNHLSFSGFVFGINSGYLQLVQF